MITEVLKSKAVEGVIPRGAMATKKPSIITMALDHRFAAEAYGYFEDKKEGKLPDTGLIGFKLMALYEDGRDALIPDEEVVGIELGEDATPEDYDTPPATEDTAEEMALDGEDTDGN